MSEANDQSTHAPNFSPSIDWGANRLCERAFSCCWLTFLWLDLGPAEGHTVETSLGHTVGDLVVGKSILCRCFVLTCICIYCYIYILISGRNKLQGQQCGPLTRSWSHLGISFIVVICFVRSKPQLVWKMPNDHSFSTHSVTYFWQSCNEYMSLLWSSCRCHCLICVEGQMQVTL